MSVSSHSQSSPSLSFRGFILRLLSISVWSVLGVYLRITLTNVSESSNFFTQSDTYFLCNAIGSFIMGVFVAMSSSLQESMPWLYVGITTGLCGSFTTMSSWIIAIVFAGDINGLSQLITGLTIPFMSFIVATDLTRAIVSSTATNSSCKDSNQRVLYTIDTVVLCLLIVTFVIVVSVILSADDSNGLQPSATLITSLIGPIGAIPRWSLSLYLNNKLNLFPIGTFFANVIAVFIAAFLEHCHNNQWCTYSLTGICGSLSTVSSWVADTIRIYNQKNDCDANLKWYRYGPAMAYLYSLSTVAVCIVIAVISRSVH